VCKAVVHATNVSLFGRASNDRRGPPWSSEVSGLLLPQGSSRNISVKAGLSWLRLNIAVAYGKKQEPPSAFPLNVGSASTVRPLGSRSHPGRCGLASPRRMKYFTAPPARVGGGLVLLISLRFTPFRTPSSAKRGLRLP
jgi:hypothetical protein